MENLPEEHTTEDNKIEFLVPPLSASAKATAFVKKNIYDIIIVLVCLVYIVKGLADIQKSGKTVIEILGGGFISLLFAFTISRLLEGKGLLRGGQTNEYLSALEEYREQVKKTQPYITELEKWCAEHNDRAYREQVSIMILPAGLSYEKFIARDYDTDKFSKEQLACVKKAQKLEIHKLTTEELMSGDLECDKNKDYSKISKRKYVKRSTRKDLVSKLIISLIFGYYTLPPLTAWNWSGVLWSLLQTIAFVALGVMKYLDAYNFVNEDIREKVIDKTNKLKQFVKEKETNYEHVGRIQETGENFTGSERPCGGEYESVSGRICANGSGRDGGSD